MEKSEFLYIFTDIFLSEAVKETILIESWEEKDFDPRYEEYLKFFLEMKKGYLSGKFSDQQIKDILTTKKNNLVLKFNKKFHTHFVNEFIKHGCTEKIARHFLPKDLFADSQINENILEKFRELEEKIANEKQGET